MQKPPEPHVRPETQADKQPVKSEGAPKRESWVAWDSFLKKYVWDDQKTPYFTPVERLTQRQADHEIFAFALFMGVLFGVLSLVSLGEGTPYGRSPLGSLYAFSVVCGAVVLNVMKSHAAAVYLGAAPAAMLVYLYMNGFSPKLGVVDQLLIVAGALLLVRYAFRLAAVVRRYPDMPEGEAPQPRRGPFG